MASKPTLTEQRDALIEEQLRNIRDALDDLKERLTSVSGQLDSVRVAELAAIRANVNDLRSSLTGELAKHDAELKLIRYQVGRSSAIWGLVSGAVVSAIVGAVLSLVMHKPG